MPIVRTRGRPRAPVRITRVGSPNLPAAKPAAKSSALLAKLKELEAKLTKNPELEQHIAQELAAHLAAIEHPKPTAKGTTKITHVAPATTPSQGHALRGALGLRSTPEQAERTAREVTQHRKAAAKAEGRAVDVPEAAKPTFVDKPNPQITEYIPGGSRLPVPGPLINQSTTYMAICELYIAANNRPIVLLASELSAMTGLSTEAVNTAITELERRRLLTRQPNRAGSVQLWAPASLTSVARD